MINFRKKLGCKVHRDVKATWSDYTDEFGVFPNLIAFLAALISTLIIAVPSLFTALTNDTVSDFLKKFEESVPPEIINIGLGLVAIGCLLYCLIHAYQKSKPRNRLAKKLKGKLLQLQEGIDPCRCREEEVECENVKLQAPLKKVKKIQNEIFHKLTNDYLNTLHDKLEKIKID